jgi:amino acid adenylation domain-containing protein
MNRWESVQELFSKAAGKYKSNIAIEGAAKRLTYGVLEEKANKLASLLMQSAASPGSIVAIMTDSTVEMIASIIGILKAGCVFVPLDANLPEQRLKAMLSDVQPRWFLVESKYLPVINRLNAENGLSGVAIILDGSRPPDRPYSNITVADCLREDNVALNRDVKFDPDMPCYIYFTSGSTGRPKGIVGRLAAIDHFVRWEIERFDIQEGTRVSQLTTPSFDAFLRDVFTPLCAGGTICLPDGRNAILDSRKLIDWIDIEQINLLHCVPSLFRSLINEELNPYYFSSLKYILMAGEPLLPSDVRKWCSIFGDRIQLVNLYGPSETTMVKLFYFVKPSDADRGSIPIGKPMEGAEALILDQSARPCPKGDVGEIYIRTPFRSLGYYNQPELTRKTFIPNPFSKSPNDIIYKTGDLGRVLEGGELEFLGRKDHQVKIRGVRVELHEIENLMREHAAVKDVAVVDREDQNGQKYLCSYVVIDPAGEPPSFRDYLAGHLPDYMIPSAFIILKALPRTQTGKVDRGALPAPGQYRSESDSPYLAPRTPAEQELVEIWQELLGVKQVSIYDNFFNLGGHSLSLTQLGSRILTSFQVELPLEVLFENPRLVDMTRAIAAAQFGQEDEVEMEKMLSELKGLSPEEIKALLEYEESN